MGLGLRVCGKCWSKRTSSASCCSITYFGELGPYQTGQPRGQFHVPDGAIPHGPMGYIVAIADGWAEV